MLFFYTCLSLSSLFFSFTLGLGLDKRQDLSGLPTCSQTCLVSSLTTSNGGCSQTDFSCLCKSAPFLKASTSCYSSVCSTSDAATATAWGVKTCASIGIDVAASNVVNATSVNNTTANTTASTNTTSSTAATGAKSAGSTVSIPSITSLALLFAMLIGSLVA
ncbi:hypothetical protein CROQUDRAFT_92589 [Cronartium quercuum f. sp. fusiforme G11]|uniref:CFEM domain-containing protein n=1 Tax=Cronartium quercuum f. sp. fusiforme G11 TaxID=708437 RepID=A0A9P6TBN5_9BASI|nr:hypothetical protein CROQUDRAFT_92589 [Cronartium quercuum f. sp. fusiforme G11]